MGVRSSFFCLLIATAFMGSCSNTGSNNANDPNKPLPPIALEPVGKSPEFKDAEIKLATINTQKLIKDSVSVTFDFLVKNYELKAQTSDTGSKMCNNSAQGQHIHFILDNQPYKALYEPKNEITVHKKSEHYLMAFLSRSYHESIKEKGAALLYHFKINDQDKLEGMDEPKNPMIFYSRPKGDYIGKDTANVLLDFYLWNCSLSADGYKVKARITNNDIPGHDTTFTITEWKPHFIKNLGTGKCHVVLTLVDKDGKNVQGDNTTASRNFKLAAAEPVK